jgi:hypothetical protein
MKVKELGEWVRELSIVDENDDLVVSCYVDLTQDWRGHTTALRRRAEAVRASLPADRASEFDAALTLIETHLDEESSKDVKSAAFFVRGGDDGFFVPLFFQVPTETWIGVDRVPNIYQLVEMKDRYHRYVVLLCGTESIRVLEVNLGSVTAEIWQERPDLRQRVGREWTKQHYQRHEKAVTERFLKEAVQVLRQRMDKGGYKHLVLVGNSVTLSKVEGLLPRSLSDQVVDSLVMASQDRLQDVVQATLAAFVEEEQRESLSMVEQLEHHLYKTGLAVAGPTETRRALATGAADVLVMSTQLSEASREEFVRLAEKSSSLVELVDESITLARLGGVGCLLRYRPFDAGEPLGSDSPTRESALR